MFFGLLNPLSTVMREPLCQPPLSNAKCGLKEGHNLPKVHIASKWLDQAVNPGSVTSESKCFHRGSPESAVLSPGWPWTHAEGVCLRARPAKTKTVVCFKSQALTVFGKVGVRMLPRKHWGDLTSSQ